MMYCWLGRRLEQALGYKASYAIDAIEQQLGRLRRSVFAIMQGPLADQEYAAGPRARPLVISPFEPDIWRPQRRESSIRSRARSG